MILKSIFKIKSSDFSRCFFSMSIGTVGAQIGILLASPLLTRLYSPEQFGAYSLFQSSVASIMYFTLCYELAIPQPKKNKNARHLLIACISCALAISITLSVSITAVFSILDIKNEIFTLPFTLLIFLGALLWSLNKALTSWFCRIKKFNIVAVNKFLWLLCPLIQVLTGLIGKNGLLLGYCLALLIQSIALFIGLDMNFYREAARTKIGKFIEQLKTHKRFPVYQLPTQVLNSTSQFLPSFILSSLYSLSIAGFYSLSIRLLSLPISLIGQGLRQAYYQEACKKLREKQSMLNLYLSTIGKLSIFSFLPFLFLFLWSEEVIVFCFGSKWAEAGYMLKITTIMSFSQIINPPATMSFHVYNKQKFLFGFEVCQITLKFLALTIPYFAGLSYNYSMLLFSLVSAVLNFVLIAIAFQLNAKHAKNIKDIILN